MNVEFFSGWKLFVFNFFNFNNFFFSFSCLGLKLILGTKKWYHSRVSQIWKFVWKLICFQVPVTWSIFDLTSSWVFKWFLVNLFLFQTILCELVLVVTFFKDLFLLNDELGWLARVFLLILGHLCLWLLFLDDFVGLSRI